MMTVTPRLAAISIYPLKSLDGMAVASAKLLPSGALWRDREFAIFDARGGVVNGKRYPQIHRLRSRFDGDCEQVTLRIQGETTEFSFHLSDPRNLEVWLSEFFGFAVTIGQDSVLGFPDDTEASGPTLISTATLATVAAWFSGMSVAQMRSRLRANLEIDGVPAFWEDRLFGAPGEMIPFQIGAVELLGVNPCQRCVVPTRNSETGEATPQFQKIFTGRRQETLPSWVNRSRFHHFYRLGVNTNVSPAQTGKELRLGDTVKHLALTEGDR